MQSVSSLCCTVPLSLLLCSGPENVDSRERIPAAGYIVTVYFCISQLRTETTGASEPSPVNEQYLPRKGISRISSKYKNYSNYLMIKK